MRRPPRASDEAPSPRRRPSLRAEALRLLARRPRTRHELRSELGKRGHSEAAVDALVRRFEETGYLNDVGLARHYIVTRAERLLHGPERLLAELERRGVSRDHAEQALRDAIEEGALAPDELLRKAVQRRLAGRARLGSTDFARVYNALLRAGYDGNDVRLELEPYRAAVDPSGSLLDDGTNDDLA